MDFIITKTNSFLKDANTSEFLIAEMKKQTQEHQFHFRLFDDDRVMYFEGFSKKKWDFQPLDDFGISYGCTEIQYWNNNKFELT